MADLFHKPPRQPLGGDVRREAATAVRKVCLILLELVPEGPSPARVAVRNLLGECNELLGEHRSRASDIDVAHEVEDEFPEE